MDPGVKTTTGNVQKRSNITLHALIKKGIGNVINANVSVLNALAGKMFNDPPHLPHPTPQQRNRRSPRRPERAGIR